MCIEISNWSELDPATQSTLLARPALQTDAKIGDQVGSILEQVQCEGDVAIRRLTQEFDQGSEEHT